MGYELKDFNLKIKGKNYQTLEKVVRPIIEKYGSLPIQCMGKKLYFKGERINWILLTHNVSTVHIKIGTREDEYIDDTVYQYISNELLEYVKSFIPLINNSGLERVNKYFQYPGLDHYGGYYPDILYAIRDINERMWDDAHEEYIEREINDDFLELESVEIRRVKRSMCTKNEWLEVVGEGRDISPYFKTINELVCWLIIKRLWSYERVGKLLEINGYPEISFKEVCDEKR